MLTAILMLSLTVCGLLFACASNQLSKPQLKAYDNKCYISWESIENAKNYKITDTVNGTTKIFFTPSTKITFNDEGLHVVTVAAQGDGVKYKNSEAARTTINITAENLARLYGESRKSDIAAPQDLNYRYYFNPQSGKPLSFGLRYDALNSAQAVGLRAQHYTVNNGTLEIASNYLSNFSVGANIEMTLQYDNGISEVVVLVAATSDAPQISNIKSAYVKVDKSSNQDVVLMFDDVISANTSFVSISLNGSQSDLFSQQANESQQKSRTENLVGFDNYFSLSEGKNLTVKSELISLLEIGINSFVVHSTNGGIVFKIDTYSSSAEIFNVNFEFDKHPGEYFIEWNCENTAPNVSFSISDGNNVYTSTESDSIMTYLGDGNWHADVTQCGFADKSLITLETLIDGVVKHTKYVTVKIPSVTEKLYLQNTFDYLGNTYNKYISNDYEMEIFAHHIFLDSSRPAEASSAAGYVYSDTIYIDTNNLSSDKLAIGGEVIIAALKKYRGTYREATKISSNITVRANGENVYSISMRIYSYNEATSVSARENQIQKMYDQDGNLCVMGYASDLGRAVDFDNFAINSISKTANVSTSDQLYFAVESGLKPICAENSSAARMYDAAKDVLRQIVDDNMSPLQKSRAIFEWICTNVRYDHATIADMSGISTSSDNYNVFYGRNCFYLEGVFDDNVAVCNGLSKAFVLLCRLEGIEAIKENGTAKASAEAHAWNKVKINGVWYICDATWAITKDSRLQSTTSDGYWNISDASTAAKPASETYEFYSEKFFLMSEAELKLYDSYRKVDVDEQSGNYYADTSYDTFASDVFEYTLDGFNYIGDHIILDEEDMKALIAYYKSASRKSFAVKVSSSGGVGADKMAMFEQLAAQNGLSLKKTCVDAATYNGSIGYNIVYYRVLN